MRTKYWLISTKATTSRSPETAPRPQRSTASGGKARAHCRTEIFFAGERPESGKKLSVRFRVSTEGGLGVEQERISGDVWGNVDELERRRRLRLVRRSRVVRKSVLEEAELGREGGRRRKWFSCRWLGYCRRCRWWRWRWWTSDWSSTPTFYPFRRTSLDAFSVEKRISKPEKFHKWPSSWKG